MLLSESCNIFLKNYFYHVPRHNASINIKSADTSFQWDHTRGTQMFACGAMSVMCLNWMHSMKILLNSTVDCWLYTIKCIPSIDVGIKPINVNCLLEKFRFTRDTISPFNLKSELFKLDSLFNLIKSDESNQKFYEFLMICRTFQSSPFKVSNP